MTTINIIYDSEPVGEWDDDDRVRSTHLCNECGGFLLTRMTRSERETALGPRAFIEPSLICKECGTVVGLLELLERTHPIVDFNKLHLKSDRKLNIVLED